MTREEAAKYFKRHINLYCVDGVSRQAEEMAIKALEQEPCEEKLYHAKECYSTLCDYFQDDPLFINTILNDRGEFKKWLERLRWHIKKCDELFHELESIKKKPSCEDCVSRAAVLDLCDSKDPNYRICHFREDVECLPAVMPRI